VTGDVIVVLDRRRAVKELIDSVHDREEELTETVAVLDAELCDTEDSRYHLTEGGFSQCSYH